jgi:phosphoglycerate dehydrogenase-like enzyme
MDRTKIGLLLDVNMTANIFEDKYLEKLGELGDLRIAKEPGRLTIESIAPLVEGADVLVTGWGSPKLTKEVLDTAPDLKLIVHAAGTVKGIVCDEVWERGIVVTSGAPVIAIGVAETTLGFIISSLKNFWGLSRSTREGAWNSPERAKCKELFGVTIGIISASNVGRHLMKLLKNFDVDIQVYDPVKSAEEIEVLGGKKVELKELFATSDVVTVHAPSIPATKGMVNKELLELMKDGAILINTARGDIINEAELIEELKRGRITACIDVTSPEPPAIDNPLRTLPNVILTPHVAGLANNGRYRLGRYAVDEVTRFVKGEEQLHEVKQEILGTLA